MNKIIPQWSNTYMKKIFPVLLVLLMASSIFAQEQNKAITTAAKYPASNVIVGGRLVTDADSGKTITLHIGKKLYVELPNERHYVSGDEHYGLESVSTVSFDGLSNEGVLNVNTLDLGDGSTLQDDRSFVAASVGQTTLSYTRTTSFVGHGNVAVPDIAVPDCVAMQPISFNIVVE